MFIVRVPMRRMPDFSRVIGRFEIGRPGLLGWSVVPSTTMAGSPAGDGCVEGICCSPAVRSIVFAPIETLLGPTEIGVPAKAYVIVFPPIAILDG